MRADERRRALRPVRGDAMSTARLPLMDRFNQCIVAHRTMTRVHDTPLEPSLLFSLDALLQEKSVSRAAARVGLTQSAMSRVLGRLRAQLRDPLLVRAGRSMALSPRAEAMATPLRRALDDLAHVLTDYQSFNPATSRRSFRIATVDYAVALLVVPLMSHLAREAPGVEVMVETLRDDFETELHTGALDVVLAPRRKSTGSLVWTKLRSERFVSVLRGDHPRAPRGLGLDLNLDLFCALSHVVVVPERRVGNRIDTLLTEHGRTRHIALRVPSFLAALLTVADSDLLLTTAESVARRVATGFDLRILDTPLPLGELTLSMAWHERQRDDAGHTWLRAMLTKSASA